MNQEERKSEMETRQRKKAEALRFSEDRAQLLDTIREMIDTELERRGVPAQGLPAQTPRRSFRQWLMRLFSMTVM